jgi:hypothetical protein
MAWKITSGHPQLVQQLGDNLVHILNDREASNRVQLTPRDIEVVATSYDYREHYLETYWGQATKLERLISLTLSMKDMSVGELASHLQASGVEISDDDLKAAIRILVLYGIIEAKGNSYALRAQWFPIALESFGGADAVIDRLLGR